MEGGVRAASRGDISAESAESGESGKLFQIVQIIFALTAKVTRVTLRRNAFLFFLFQFVCVQYEIIKFQKHKNIHI